MSGTDAEKRLRELIDEAKEDIEAVNAKMDQEILHGTGLKI